MKLTECPTGCKTHTMQEAWARNQLIRGGIMSGCGGSCAGASMGGTMRANEAPAKEKMNDLSKVKRVIGVVSGKGGVGKSTVTSLLATEMKRAGKKVAVLDADITGPSIPKMFGITGQNIGGMGNYIFPATTKTDIKVMSINLLLEKETDPVLWRGPVVGGAIKQFWSEVAWGDIDYMFVDMPPGTGDVALTVFQSLPVDGLIIITSPQDLVSMIVSKAVKMADAMNIPVLGLVENYSYLKCPDCNKEIQVFGASHIEEVSKTFRLPVLGKLPIDPALANLCDNGQIEDVQESLLPIAINELLEIPEHVYEDEKVEKTASSLFDSSSGAGAGAGSVPHDGASNGVPVGGAPAGGAPAGGTPASGMATGDAPAGGMPSGCSS